MNTLKKIFRTGFYANKNSRRINVSPVIETITEAYNDCVYQLDNMCSMIEVVN